MLLFMYKITNITLHKIATCYDVVSTVIYQAVCEHVYLRTLIQVRERVRTCDVVLMIAEYTSLLVVLLISASAMSLVIVWGRKKLSSGDSPSTCKTVIKILSNIQHI